MNARSHPRKPAAFRLDDPHVRFAEGEERRRGHGGVFITPEPDMAAAPAPAEVVIAPPRRRISWAKLFWAAAAGLVGMGASLAVVRMVEDLFARAPWLGWMGLALAVMAAVALVVLIVREALALARLAEVEKLRRRAAEAITLDDRDEARSVARELIAFARGVPRLARGRTALEGHLQDIIDGADLIRLAERELMPTLDAAARKMVADAATRVSVVTAVSPRAAIDLAFVLITAMTLIRRLSELYGGRPGTLGLIRLVRLVVAHLVVTGGMAAGDSVVQQMLGHGVAAKLSARLGEGVLNGLLTARLGMAAIEVTRPLPFAALPPPSMSDLAGGLLRRRGEDKTEGEPSAAR
jgi:putative membrane protein